MNKKSDLVCGMDISKFNDALKFSYKGSEFYFCGNICRERFKKKPEKFLGEPIIRLDNIWKIFKKGKTETEVLKGISLNIWKGDFVSIIGASGSGKSTVLNLLGLLDKPSSGNFYLKGKDASKFKEDERAEFRSGIFGFVFQQYNLIPWLTSYENASLPMIFSRKNLKKDGLSAKFEEVGLFKRINHRPVEMSGGEQQRTALLRALINDPEIILGDEPTGNLDSKTGNKILEMLIDLNKKEGKTLVIVTHDADIAKEADQVITVKDGEVVRNHEAHKREYTE